MRSVLFVCTANICRSPMAEGVLRSILAGLRIDSAGTHDYQAGKPPFDLAVESARRRGHDITRQVARRVKPQDFDHILVMDRKNLEHLKTICPTRCKSTALLLCGAIAGFLVFNLRMPWQRQARLADCVSLMIRRLRARKSPFVADRGHIHRIEHG